MKKKCILVLLGVMLGSVVLMDLSACHMVKMRSNDDQYLNVKTAPVLTVPKDASHKELGNDFPVPGNVYPVVEKEKPVSMVPPGSLYEAQLAQKAQSKKN